ncbi:MAG: nucleotidyltransferase family protein [Defluviitaleaceae bacterium]|nr:nucleotidyltransferase family protein [Defluviitaleaceae bacterium]
MKVIILAAGYATRLYPLTENFPKALLAINNKPMLGYIIDKVDQVNEVDDIFIVSNGKFAKHFEQWKDGYTANKNIVILNNETYEPENMLGSIGDIIFTINKMNIDDETMIICGDNLFNFSLTDFVAFYKKSNADCICTKELNNVEELRRFGIATVDHNNIVTDFVEKPDIPKSNLVAYCIYAFTKDTVKLTKKYADEGGNLDALGNFLQWLYKFKPIHCYKFQGECFDIGTLEAYNKANTDGLFTTH